MNNSNILVVEDDAAIRSLITTALETENYKYHVAKNGNQAIMLHSGFIWQLYGRK